MSRIKITNPTQNTQDEFNQLMANSRFTSRTRTEYEELWKHQMITIAKNGLEGIFGALWIFLLLVVFLTYRDLLWIWLKGPSDRYEEKRLKEFKKNRIFRLMFLFIVCFINFVLVTTTGARVIFFKGLITSTVIYIVYKLYDMKNPGKLDFLFR